MNELAEAVSLALASGENVIAAIRAASGYTIEQLSIATGLAESELVEIEAGIDTTHLARLLSALGLRPII